MAYPEASAEQLYNRLLLVLNNTHLCDVAISPYIIPLEEKVEEDADESGVGKFAPSAIHPFTLFDSDKLVIPQKPLYLAFAYAVKVLGKRYHRKTLRKLFDERSHGNAHLGEIQKLDDLTKVIILQNPEHVKSLNIRRQIVLRQTSTEGRYGDGTPESSRVIQELHFVKLVLGIAANAKMGTLWSYRRWLFSLQSERLNSLSTNTILLCSDDLSSEVDLLAKCCQKYPRNYQAWFHRSWLMEPYFRLSRDPDHLRAVDGEVHDILQHISRNLTDHTAVHHLLRLIHVHMQSLISDKRERNPYFEAVYSAAIDLVHRYPYKETPWLFLRGTVWLSMCLPKEVGRHHLHAALKVTQSSLSKSLPVVMSAEMAGSSNANQQDSLSSTTMARLSLSEAQKASLYAKRTLHYLNTSSTEGRCSAIGYVLLSER